jgi:glucose-1-phosphate thymidylyltransferase
VETIEKRQGYKIACLEEIAFSNNWISREILKKSAENLSKNGYGRYLKDLLDRKNS